MDVAFSVPDRLAERLQKRFADLSERALQAIVADGYREESLTLGEVREVGGHSTRMETEQFLKDRGVLLDMTEEDLEEDARAAREGALVGISWFPVRLGPRPSSSDSSPPHGCC